MLGVNFCQFSPTKGKPCFDIICTNIVECGKGKKNNMELKACFISGWPYNTEQVT